MPADAPIVEIFLHPGEYFVGDASHRISTLLGSCVSIALWHPGRRIGALSHFLLPERGTAAAGPPDPRYGRDAVELMLRDLRRMDVSPPECRAKLFGGGDMFPRQPIAARVGRSNGETARQLVREHGISIVSESLFGVGHRKIIFVVATGDVWARRAAAGQPRDARRDDSSSDRRGR